MVGPGDVDNDLEPEVKDECNTKYGDVVKVLIHEVKRCANFSLFHCLQLITSRLRASSRKKRSGYSWNSNGLRVRLKL